MAYNPDYQNANTSNPQYQQEPQYGQPPVSGHQMYTAPPPGQQQQVIVVNHTNYDHCPTCQQNTGSRIVAQPGTGSWLICLGMCIVGLWCCCCIPFCVEELQDKKYYCTTCNNLKADKPLIK